MEIERRFVTGLEVRAHDGKTRLVGLAVPYQRLSEDMGFREIIQRGAFSEHLATKPDITALIEHDPARIIGRTRSGTLQLIENDSGVRVSIDPPDSQAGRDIVESVRRGDLVGMSFGFRVPAPIDVNATWGTIDGEMVRTINKGELDDVSVVARPSYLDTTVAARSLSRWKQENRSMTTDVATVETSEEKMPPKSTAVPPPAETSEEKMPQPERRSVPAQPVETATMKRDPAEWRDYRTGKEVRILGRDQRFADVYRTDEPLSLGRAIRALIVGHWDDAPAERRALSTTAGPSAAILVPNPLSASVIDKARALAVLTRAGARFVDMGSSTLTIARVSADATVEVKAENVQFSGSDVTFDAIEMTAYTLGCLVKMSRELAADAPNAVSLIENKLAAVLAEKIDRYGLRGTGSQQPLGLINFGSTNTVNVGGSVDYDDILDGLKENEIDNHVSGAVIGSPTNWSVLRQLKVNSEVNHYAEPPAAVRDLLKLSTSNMPDTDMVVGDFSQLLIGLRQGVLIEVSTEADTAFAAHEIWIKATWRGCFSAEHRDAFCLLQSIS